MQRQKLLQQIAAQRQEINLLHDRVGNLEQQHQDYQQTVLFVNRYWGQLNDDVLYMLARSSAAALPALESADQAEEVLDYLSNIEDPVLRRLLTTSTSSITKAAQDGQRAIVQNTTDVEQVLNERLLITKESLSKLLDALTQSDGSKQQATPEQQDAANAAATEAATLRQNMDSLRAAQRTSQEQLRQSDDKVLLLEQQKRDLTTQLAEREQQVLNLVKKLKLAGGSSGSDAADAALGVGRSSQPGGSGSSSVDEAMALLQKDLQAAEAQLQDTLALLDSEREAHLRTKAELQAALSKGPDDAQIISSPLYQHRCAASPAASTPAADLQLHSTALRALACLPHPTCHAALLAPSPLPPHMQAPPSHVPPSAGCGRRRPSVRSWPASARRWKR